MCVLIRTVRIMNDQIGTVSAGQEVLTRDQSGPDEAMLEQRVAGSFFDFSLTHPARSEGAVVHQRGRPRRPVTAKQPAPCRCPGRSLRRRCGAERSSLDRDLGGAGLGGCGEEWSVYDPRVASGQEPQWRMAWEESLSDSERAQVRAAVGNGQPVEDPRLAVFAVGLAAKARRRARLWPWVVVFNAAIISGWVYIACIREESLVQSPEWCGFWLVLGVVLLTVVPIRALKAKGRAMEALRSNGLLMASVDELEPRGGSMTVERFKDDESGYTRWLKENPLGFVLNIERSLGRSGLRLHKADCRTIQGTPPRGDTWTGAYIKVCSIDKQALIDWAERESGETPPSCGVCSP
jgi:hypothetical protein